MQRDDIVVFVGYCSFDQVITVMVPSGSAVGLVPESTLSWRFSAMRGHHVDAQQGASLRDGVLFAGRLGNRQQHLATQSHKQSGPNQPLWNMRRQFLVAREGIFERVETGNPLHPYEFSWHAAGAPYRTILAPLNPASFSFTGQDSQFMVASKPRTVRMVGEAQDGTIVCITTVGDDALSTEVYLGSRHSGVGRRQIMSRVSVLRPEAQTYMTYVGRQKTYLFVRPGAEIRQGLPRSLRGKYPVTGLYAAYGEQTLKVLDPSFITHISPSNSEVYWRGTGA